MKSMFSWLLAMLMGIFWAFRVAVALMASLQKEFMATPLNETIEVGLLFAVLIPIILVIKRKLIGGILYLLLYGGYFGVHFVNNMQALLEETVVLTDYTNIIFSFFGLLLPILVLIDLIIDKSRAINPKDKKTDWFYQNEAYDRQYDERADRNKYKTL